MSGVPFGVFPVLGTNFASADTSIDKLGVVAQGAGTEDWVTTDIVLEGDDWTARFSDLTTDELHTAATTIGLVPRCEATQIVYCQCVPIERSHLLKSTIVVVKPSGSVA